MRKILSIFLAITLLLSVFCIVPNAASFNDEYEVMPCWTSISSYSAALDVNGLTASAYVTLNAIYKTNLKITVQLQKETSTGYEDVKTWTASRTSDVSVTLSESKLINPLNDYRLRITMTADEETIVVFKYP